MRTERRIVLALSAVAVLTAVNGGSIAYAQAEPAFEVSQVTGNRQARISRTPQRIAFQPAWLGDIMAFAYGLPLDRIERRPQRVVLGDVRGHSVGSRVAHADGVDPAPVD